MPGPKFPCPTAIISANNKNVDGTHQVSPSWVVAFVRFEEPASIYSNAKSNLQKTTEKISVIENDCVSVSITNSKRDFGKHCDLTMKVGEIYYPHLVAPGDWVFVWMVDYQEDADKIARLLLGSSPSNGGGVLNNWNSGLKFVGRVIEIDDIQRVAGNGRVDLTQRIQCQGFLEFATSIYHTYMSKAIVTPGDSLPANSNNTDTAKEAAAQHTDAMDRAMLDVHISQFLPSIDDKFKEQYNEAKAVPHPDEIIEIFFVLVFGMDKSLINMKGRAQGAFSDAIKIPKQVAMILNTSAQKLWEIYRVHLGIQTYNSNISQSPWNNFSPIFDETQTAGSTETQVFFRTKDRCTGSIPFMPPQWDGSSAWQFLHKYVNEPFNEMYTSLRCHADNKILPTLTVREVPLGTNLYNVLQVGTYFEAVEPQFSVKEVNSSSVNEESESKEPVSTVVQSTTDLSFTIKNLQKRAEALDTSNMPRTKFENLPRWLIDESMVISISTKVSEVNRVNMVQVFGGTPGADYIADPQALEAFKKTQLNTGNFVVDDADIARHGLRMQVIDTPYGDIKDSYMGVKTVIHWAKLKADHYFNGHLKPFGTVILKGIQKPICEGDNIQVQGIVYHIDGVTHEGSIDANGRKTFTTVLTVSNGILAGSLTGSKDQLPAYPVHHFNIKRKQIDLPAGVTDVQRTLKTNRDPGGDDKS